tara:strand:+ start:102 stop:398 length:297 start_codon:yes stop_codon:yes gene_type:complete
MIDLDTILLYEFLFPPQAAVHCGIHEMVEEVELPAHVPLHNCVDALASEAQHDGGRDVRVTQSKEPVDENVGNVDIHVIEICVAPDLLAQRPHNYGSG